MKNVQIMTQKLIISSTLITAGFLAQACGSSSTGNVSAVTATPATGTVGQCTTGLCTTSPGTVYSSCAAYGQMTTVTYNGSNVSVCRYTVTQSQYFDVEASEMNIVNSGGLSASGGNITNLQLSQGDKLELVSFGHYTPSGGVCDSNNGGGDISVLGNSNGKDPTINVTNGENVGLWYAFENSSGQYSTPVNATVQYDVGSGYQSIQVPMGSASNNLVLGYNWNGSIGCGDMGAYYTIIRCADANGNTYTCN
jgi:hypothetical protein